MAVEPPAPLGTPADDPALSGPAEAVGQVPDWVPPSAISANGRVPDRHESHAGGSLPVRQINLSTLMRLVHTRGPMSRADLTRATGLNRSTVGVLLAELSERGRVLTGAPAPGRTVGRPSPLIHAAPQTVALTVYPDADAIELAVVGLNGLVKQRVRQPVSEPPTPQQTVALTTQMIEDLGTALDDVTPMGLGMAVPGLVRASDGFVHMAPHLPWRDVPIAELMHARTGLPTSVGNDAAVGTDAEATFGAGRGSATMVYLHGGFGGIGSGVRMGGRHRPALSAGTVSGNGSSTGDGGAYLPELGHLMVNSSGRRCHCGAIGCLETEVSLERLRTAVTGPTQAPETGPSAPRRSPAADDSHALAQALADHGGSTQPEVQRQLGFLATGIRNAVNAFAPDLVILGGFLGTLLDLAGDELIEAVHAQLMPPLASVQLRRGTLGANRIHIGAAEAVFEPLLRDPLTTRVP